MILNYITWNVDPVLFHLGALQVRWYGLLWALGFFFGYFVMRNIYRHEKLSDDWMDKLLIYMLVSTVIGARLGHCLFYEPEYYLSHPLKMLAIWEGGLASHGGAICILTGLWIYVRVYNKSTKKKKDEKQRISYIWILDRIVVPVCLVGALIRVGNVMNHEIYGTPTSLPWGFVFLRGAEQFCGTFDNYTPCYAWEAPCPPSEWLPCHPTGLYEAFFCLVAMGILLWMYYKRDLGNRRPGLMFGTFLIIIFGSRIGIEFLKNVQVDFERDMVFDMGQWLSVPFVLVGIGMIVWSFVKGEKQEKLR
jgi:prolipoprotein diacylglyceryl transferase